MTTEQSAQALEPCPFCGAPASGYAIEPHTHALVFAGVKMPDHPGSYVIEGDCACGSGLIGETQAEVTERWNRRRQPAAAQLAGWKLVPVEPTEEMIRAAAYANLQIPRPKWDRPTLAEILSTEYRAAVDAAPPPPTQPKEPTK